MDSFSEAALSSEIPSLLIPERVLIPHPLDDELDQLRRNYPSYFSTLIPRFTVFRSDSSTEQPIGAAI